MNIGVDAFDGEIDRLKEIRSAKVKELSDKNVTFKKLYEEIYKIDMNARKGKMRANSHQSIDQTYE